VPGELGVDTRLDAIFRIGAAIEVLREQRLALRMRQEVLVQGLKLLLALLAVAVPPDGVFRQRIDNRMLVLRRAAGVMAGLGAERATGDDRSLAVANRVLVERGFGQVPVNRAEILEAELVGAIGGVAQTEQERCRGAPDEVFRGKRLSSCKLCHDVGEREGEAA